MNCSTKVLPVHHQLRELTQTHVHGIADAIQPSHPLLSPSMTSQAAPQLHSSLATASVLHSTSATKISLPAPGFGHFPELLY